jgi:hypothetical protein
MRGSDLGERPLDALVTLRVPLRTPVLALLADVAASVAHPRRRQPARVAPLADLAGRWLPCRHMPARTAVAVEAATALRKQKLADRIERGVRVCGRCHVEKPLSEFGPGPEADGKRSYCRPCCAAWKREHSRPQVADSAAAIDSISVRKRTPRKPDLKWNLKPPTEDYRTPAASRDPRTRATPLYHERDAELEQFCIACTPVWAAGWEHDQSCPFRRSRPRA